MAPILGGLAILYVLRTAFYRLPLLAWLGPNRLAKYRTTASRFFARKPLKVKVVERYPQKYAPHAFEYLPAVWETPSADAANCLAHLHETPEDGLLTAGYRGRRRADMRLLRLSYRLVLRGGTWAAWPRLLLGLRLDGLRRATWLSLLRSDARTLTAVFYDPNTNNLHAYRLNRDGKWSEKAGRNEARYDVTLTAGQGLTGRKLVGYYWLPHQDSAPRAVHGLEPRTRVRLRSESFS